MVDYGKPWLLDDLVACCDVGRGEMLWLMCGLMKKAYCMGILIWAIEENSRCFWVVREGGFIVGC